MNDADPVDVEIEKVWVIEGSGGDQVDTHYKLTLYCDAQIAYADYCHGQGDSVDSPEGNGSSWNCKKRFYGDGSDVFTAHVTPEYPSSHCWVDESVYDDAVEIDNDCGNIVISAGTGDSCVITNTVFFEGIPTLSQYGMAIKRAPTCKKPLCGRHEQTPRRATFTGFLFGQVPPIRFGICFEKIHYHEHPSRE